MIFRFRVIQILSVVLAIGLVNINESSAQDSERDYIEQIVPGLTQLREFTEKIEARLAEFSRLFKRTPSADNAANPADSLAEDVETPGERRYQEQLRREFLKERDNAIGEHYRRVDNIRKQLRIYVSASVDRCKKHVAAGDEIGARASCGIAEDKIEQCKRQVVPEIDQLANRLTVKYRLNGDDNFRFETILHCDSVFAGLDDPGRILRGAEFRLLDDACYAHARRVEVFARTGAIPGLARMGKDDESVPAYLSFIKRKCPESIASQARLDVIEATKAKENAERQSAEELARRMNPPPEEVALALPRRGGNSGSAIFQEAINQAEEDVRDPSARVARERAARERAANVLALEQEQAHQSSQNASEGLAVLGQVLGAIGQYQQANQVRQQIQRPLIQAQQQAQRQASQPREQEHGRIYYPPLGCASIASMPYGNKTIPTMRNNCGRVIEAHFSGGQWSIGTGQSYSYQTNTVFYAACEKNDAYDRSQNQCKR